MISENFLKLSTRARILERVHGGELPRKVVETCVEINGNTSDNMCDFHISPQEMMDAIDRANAFVEKHKDKHVMEQMKNDKMQLDILEDLDIHDLPKDVEMIEIVKDTKTPKATIANEDELIGLDNILSDGQSYEVHDLNDLLMNNVEEQADQTIQIGNDDGMDILTKTFQSVSENQLPMSDHELNALIDNANMYEFPMDIMTMDVIDNVVRPGDERNDDASKQSHFDHLLLREQPLEEMNVDPVLDQGQTTEAIDVSVPSDVKSNGVDIEHQLCDLIPLPYNVKETPLQSPTKKEYDRFVEPSHTIEKEWQYEELDIPVNTPTHVDTEWERHDEDMQTDEHDNSFDVSTDIPDSFDTHRRDSIQNTPVSTPAHSPIHTPDRKRVHTLVCTPDQPAIHARVQIPVYTPEQSDMSQFHVSPGVFVDSASSEGASIHNILLNTNEHPIVMISDEVLPVTSMSEEVLQKTMRTLPKTSIAFDNVMHRDVEQCGVDVVVLQTNDTLDCLNKDESSSDIDYVHLSQDRPLNDVMYDIVDEMEKKEEREDDHMDIDPSNVQERVVMTDMPTIEHFETLQEAIHTVLEPNVCDVVDIPFRSDDIREPNINNSPFLVNEPPFLSDTVLVSNAQNVDEGLLFLDTICQPRIEYVDDDTVLRSNVFIKGKNGFLFGELDENINTPLESTTEIDKTFESVPIVDESLETTIETVDKPLETTIETVDEPLETTIETVDEPLETTMETVLNVYEPLETTIETVETVCNTDEPLETTVETVHKTNEPFVEMIQNTDQVPETTTKPNKRAIEEERTNANETKGVTIDVSQIRKKPRPNEKETV